MTPGPAGVGAAVGCGPEREEGAAALGDRSVEMLGVAAGGADPPADADAPGLPAAVAAPYLTMGLVVPSGAMVPAWLVSGSL